MYSYLRRFYGGYGLFLYKFCDATRDAYRQIGKRDRWGGNARKNCRACTIPEVIFVDLDTRFLHSPDQP
jgi:hypothetical protein